MNGSSCSRADLVRVLAAQDGLVPAAAGLMGYSPIEVVHDEQARKIPGETSAAAESSIDPPPVLEIPDGDWPAMQAPASAWQAFSYEQREPLPVEKPKKWELTWRDQEQLDRPHWYPIAEWRSLIPRLRMELTETARSSRVDIDRAVRQLAESQLMGEVPRQAVRRWGDRLQVIVDRSERLIPFRQDMAWFLENLKRLLPGAAIQLAIYDESRDALRLVKRGQATSDYRYPPLGASMVVLGDLGALSQGEQAKTWLKWATGLLEREGHALAVVPCSSDRVARPLRASLRVIPWQKLAFAQSCRDESTRRALVDRLFRRLSQAKRIEPGLLRAMRRSIAEATDASLEADFWQDSRLASRHCRGASLHGDRLADFRSLSMGERREALAVLREWRQPSAPELWMSEVWGLDGDSEAFVPARDREDARRWQETFLAQDELSDAQVAWLARATDGLSREALLRQRHLRELHRRIHAHDELLGGDPQELRSGETVDVAVGQMGDSLMCCRGDSKLCEDARWHWLGRLQTRTGTVVVCEEELVGRDSFWKSGRAPSWASDWGRDKYGCWVEFQVGGEAGTVVTQRMRWIPAGTFLMGSPESEEVGYDDEGPQHEVTFTRGFWMFDTPVTQDLWHAVIRDNPIHFTGDRRPVDRISWNDTRRFLDWLDLRMRVVTFDLPTEAQWEYACRAGTTTAYSFGDRPESLKDFAWYRSNSGDTAHEVAEKWPNPWGLFDMHGNVREWCQDYWADDYREAAGVDPTGPAQGKRRVLRGGAWNSLALNVRSAYRSHDGAAYMRSPFGFRCVQIPTNLAEPRGGEWRPSGAHAAATTGGVAMELQIDSDKPQAVAIPHGRRISIRSDVEAIELRRITKPEWACAMGRDRYGLWAEFTLKGVVQRMRWIPPGRFLMGSADEDGMDYGDERPQHEVTLSHGYWLFDTPVTQALWQAVVNMNPSYFEGATRPVEQVSWDDCQTFLHGINQAVTGLNLSLPTEAEWECACRAGSISRYAFRDDITPELARYDEGDSEKNGTSEVSRFPPNSWGLFDMHGNIWEWCQDWYGEYGQEAQLNPQGPREGRSRVSRGGSWIDNAHFVRSASRNHSEPGYRFNFTIGFRCAQVRPSSRGREQGGDESIDGADERCRLTVRSLGSESQATG
jgi:formylglycine-generating enzyme required for sulfatase activity